MNRMLKLLMLLAAMFTLSAAPVVSEAHCYWKNGHKYCHHKHHHKYHHKHHTKKQMEKMDETK